MRTSEDVDFDTVNDAGHRLGCDCERCAPEGCDGEEEEETAE